jgi:hypothetical protein
LIEGFQDYKTQVAPKTTILHPQPGDTLIDADQQKLYRSGIGMLLYLVKYPDQIKVMLLGINPNRQWSKASSLESFIQYKDNGQGI